MLFRLLWLRGYEVGVSKALGQWNLAGVASATFLTDNNELAGNNVREHDPLCALQAHVIYSFSSKLWGGLGATYYAGGRTTVNGTQNDDLQQNSRWGAVLGQSLDVHNAMKLHASSGLTARTGTNFTAVGIAWQYLLGAGL